MKPKAAEIRAQHEWHLAEQRRLMQRAGALLANGHEVGGMLGDQVQAMLAELVTLADFHNGAAQALAWVRGLGHEPETPVYEPAQLLEEQ